MTRINPFPIRQIDRKETNTPQAKTTQSTEVIGQLGQLPNDQALVRGFNFALENVLSGRITTKRQLNALITPRFLNGYLMYNDSNDLVQITPSGCITSVSLNGGRLSASFIKPLLQIIEARDLSNQNLARAQSEVKGFNFALENVLSGRITTKRQLNALITPRFLNGYLMYNDSNDLVQITPSGCITSVSLNDGRLSASFIKPLLQIIEARDLSNQNLARAQSEVKGFNFALENVLSGRITTKRQLNALITPRFLNGYLMYNDSNDLVQFTPSECITSESLNGGRLSSDDCTSLIKIINLLQNSNIKDELKANLQAYLETQDPDSLKRLQRVMSMSSDDSTQAEVCKLVDDLTLSLKQRELRQNVYRTITTGQDLSEALQAISAYEGAEVSDVRLKADLRDAVLARKKRDLVVQANQVISQALTDDTTIQSLLDKIDPLLKSSETSTREAGLELTRLVYQLELSELRSNLFTNITQGNFDTTDPNTNKSNIDIDALSESIAQAPIRASIPGLDYAMTVKVLKIQL